jgi:hypothetical protein
MSAGVEHWLTPIAGGLAALGVPSLAMWLLNRSATKSDDKEKLIEVLRKALDKGRVRENAYCGALDALIIGIDQLEDPPAYLIKARERAAERLETALCQVTGGE